MNTYQIKIKGMHCSGCTNLIAMNLEEQGLEEISVSLENNIGSFKSIKNINEVKELAEKAIAEAGHYALENIEQK